MGTCKNSLTVEPEIFLDVVYLSELLADTELLKLFRHFCGLIASMVMEVEEACIAPRSYSVLWSDPEEAV